MRLKSLDPDTISPKLQGVAAALLVIETKILAFLNLNDGVYLEEID